MDVLEIKNVTYTYSGSRETVLLSVNQKFELGKFYAIIGKSGAGKSTLLSLLAGLDKPNSGRILFEDEDIGKKGYSNHRRNNISLVFQNYNLIDYLSPLENIRLVNNKASEDILLELGLDKSQIKRNVMKLSGGQQQRVALARSLVLEPKVLLLDEPLSNIDTKLRETVRNEIRKIQKELGITMIFVTHDQEEAMSISDRIVVMNGGNIEQIGTPREIYTFPETVFVAEFIGKANIIKRDKKSFIIRPENVNISYNEINEGNTDEIISEKGKIISKEYHGALISYEIEVMNELSGLKRLNAVMISGKKEFETGEIVRYSINKQDLYEIKS